MYPRINYVMSEDDLKELLEACKPVPCMMIGGCAPSSVQENANRAWAKLGKKMGFDSMTVMPVQGKGMRHFTAVPTETEEQRIAREKKERIRKRSDRIDELAGQINALNEERDALMREED